MYFLLEKEKEKFVINFVENLEKMVNDIIIHLETVFTVNQKRYVKNVEVVKYVFTINENQDVRIVGVLIYVFTINKNSSVWNVVVMVYVFTTPTEYVAKYVILMDILVKYYQPEYR